MQVNPDLPTIKSPKRCHAVFVAMLLLREPLGPLPDVAEPDLAGHQIKPVGTAS